ncbi:MAG: Eco57I restriction-modification methylase domain-containing protein [Bacteroidia bacterium]|nr:Eco57I restriction-modification methylase domain-containing protein [Bacteroidia bacterium]
MKEKDLKHKLQQSFDFAIWKEILPLLFKKIDYFSHPENLFSENDKVINGKQIGTVKLDDGKQLAIFTVEVADSISIIRNRQGLREIAAKHIDQNIIHGALAFFYNKNQADYRFSFIAKEASLDLETGELIKGETKPKRYTYLLGGDEACTTPAKRMLVLADKKEKGEVNIKELKEVFSVEALNKDFFKTYKAHYEKFWKYLADEENTNRVKLIDKEKETTDKQEKPIRDFVKKLLGRIVFLQFLEKKGWMGCDTNTQKWIGGNPRFMYQLFEDFSKPEKFLSQCLNILFFETLNTKRANDIFEVKGLNGKLNGSRVPYLNGGLFEPEKNKATLEIDFPADFFKELLEFFDQYNFTIDENSPDDHEVGIDPEMLGHIFENLLEDNRDKGAFYTPKEIVQYMCKESLIQYLLNTFQEKEDIEAFIRLHTVSPFLAEKENAVLLNQKLDDIKVCDPAIGSGAFPIGMLQEIFEAKKVIHEYINTSKIFSNAEVKKNIIQNSIYGVDLEKGAVDIAQLRFWLSLVVDELNPSPLPNLDYKIMQGNSLLEQFEGIELGNAALFEEPKVRIIEPTLFEEPKAEYGFSKEKQADIKSLIEEYFRVEDKEKKTNIHKRIDNIVIDHIDKSLEFFENKLLIEIATFEKQLDRKLERLTESQKEQVISKSKEIKEIDKRKKQLESKTAARKRLLDFENTDERPYFLWHLYFMDVFDPATGSGGGFDVMIGNPPYIQLQKMGKETDTLQDAGFETFARTGDIYCLFYEKGIDLLKENSGVLSYITSNTWMRTKFGESLREYFTTKCNPEILLNFEDTQIFPSATVEVNILIAKRESFNKQVESVAVKGDYKIGTSINDYLNKNGILLSDLSKESWVILSKADYEIKNKIAETGTQLKDWNLQFFRGFLTGFNDAFFIDESKKNDLLKIEPHLADYIKPFLRGRNIKKYSYLFDDIYVLFIPWHFPLENDDSISGASEIAEKAFENKFPNLYSHFLQFKEPLSNRNKSETGIRYEWYAMQRAAATYKDEFEKEKLVWLSISDKPAFALDRNKTYVTAPAYIMTSNCNKYLMTVLNSKTMEWYLDKVSSSTGVGTNQWSKIFVEQLPIPELEETARKPYEIIAEYLIYLNDPKQEPVLEKVSNEAVSQVFEELVNMMVYELYFEEEMKAKEIDVLQFVTEKAFPDITKEEDKKAIIQKVYYELQQKDNAIRNRILVASSRSETIARINAATN